MAGFRDVFGSTPTAQPVFNSPVPEATPNEFVKGVNLGTAGVAGGFKGATAQILEPFAPDLATQMFNEAQADAQRIQAQNQLRTPEFTDVNSLSNFGDWAAGAFGQGLPSSAAGLGGAMLGRGLGRAFKMNPVASSFAGSAVGMFPQEMGESALDLRADPAAMANTTAMGRLGLSAAKGGINSALESIVPTYTVDKMIKPGAIGKGILGKASHVGKVVAQDAAGEFITEGAQQGVGDVVHHMANPAHAAFDPKGMFNAGMAGAVSGAGMGAVGGVGGVVKNTITPSGESKTLEEKIAGTGGALGAAAATVQHKAEKFAERMFAEKTNPDEDFLKARRSLANSNLSVDELLKADDALVSEYITKIAHPKSGIDPEDTRFQAAVKYMDAMQRNDTADKGKYADELSAAIKAKVSKDKRDSFYNNVNDFVSKMGLGKDERKGSAVSPRHSQSDFGDKVDGDAQSPYLVDDFGNRDFVRDQGRLSKDKAYAIARKNAKAPSGALVDDFGNEIHKIPGIVTATNINDSDAAAQSAETKPSLQAEYTPEQQDIGKVMDLLRDKFQAHKDVQARADERTTLKNSAEMREQSDKLAYKQASGIPMFAAKDDKDGRDYRARLALGQWVKNGFSDEDGGKVYIPRSLIDRLGEAAPAVVRDTWETMRRQGMTSNAHTLRAHRVINHLTRYTEGNKESLAAIAEMITPLGEQKILDAQGITGPSQFKSNSMAVHAKADFIRARLREYAKSSEKMTKDDLEELESYVGPRNAEKLLKTFHDSYNKRDSDINDLRFDLNEDNPYYDYDDVESIRDYESMLSEREAEGGVRYHGFTNKKTDEVNPIDIGYPQAREDLKTKIDTMRNTNPHVRSVGVVDRLYEEVSGVESTEDALDSLLDKYAQNWKDSEASRGDILKAINKRYRFIREDTNEHPDKLKVEPHQIKNFQKKIGQNEEFATPDKGTLYIMRPGNRMDPETGEMEMVQTPISISALLRHANKDKDITNADGYQKVMDKLLAAFTALTETSGDYTIGYKLKPKGKMYVANSVSELPDSTVLIQKPEMTLGAVRADQKEQQKKSLSPEVTLSEIQRIAGYIWNADEETSEALRNITIPDAWIKKGNKWEKRRNKAEEFLGVKAGELDAIHELAVAAEEKAKDVYSYGGRMDGTDSGQTGGNIGERTVGKDGIKYSTKSGRIGMGKQSQAVPGTERITSRDEESKEPIKRDTRGFEATHGGSGALLTGNLRTDKNLSEKSGAVIAQVEKKIPSKKDTTLVPNEEIPFSSDKVETIRKQFNYLGARKANNVENTLIQATMTKLRKENAEALSKLISFVDNIFVFKSSELTKARGKSMGDFGIGLNMGMFTNEFLDKLRDFYKTNTPEVIRNDLVAFVLTHELGHQFDFDNNISGKPEFEVGLKGSSFVYRGELSKEIHNAAASKDPRIEAIVRSTFGEQLQKLSKEPKMMQRELFANAVALYLTDESAMRELMPKTFDFIKETLNGQNSSRLGSTGKTDGSTTGTHDDVDDGGSGLRISESSVGNYQVRTKRNAEKGDITIAFAADHNTAGERATQRVVKAAGKTLVKFERLDQKLSEFAKNIVEAIKKVNGTSINVAGNGMSTWAGFGYTQETINTAMYKVLKAVKEAYPRLTTIISGGQTGTDIAGVVAAHALGLAVDVHMPKGFRQRNAQGVDFTQSQAAVEKYIKDAATQLNPEVKPVATPVRQHTMQMNYRDGYPNNHVMRPEFKGQSTLKLIIDGHRTATTRKTKPNVNVGDVIRFENHSGGFVDVRVTKAPYLISEISPAEWSKLEGWSPSVYEMYKDSWQFQYELLNKKTDQKKYSGVSAKDAKRPVDMTPEERQTVVDEITKALGKEKFATEFVSELFGPKGEKWSGSFDPINKLIQIAIGAGDAVGVARHESIHALFQLLKEHGREDIRQILEQAASNKLVMNQLKELLKDEPAALKQLSNPEEAVAYMYQFWRAGMLNIGPKTENLFQKIWNGMKRIMGWLSEEGKNLHQAEYILEAFASGAIAENHDLGLKAIYESVKGEKELLDKGNSFVQAVKNNKVLRKAVFTAGNVLRDTKNPYFMEFADKMAPEEGKALNHRGVLEATAQERARYLNKLTKIFEKYGKEDSPTIKAALKHLQSETELHDIADNEEREIVKQVRTYLREMYNYMRSKNVMRWDDESHDWVTVPLYETNYYPRVWDAEKVMQNSGKFVELLKTHYMKELQATADKAMEERAIWNADKTSEQPTGYRPGEFKAAESVDSPTPITVDDIANAIVKRIIESNGAADIEETTSNLGITPYAAAVNKRTLHFIEGKHFTEFMGDDMVQQLANYTVQLVKRAEFTEVFGNEGEGMALLADKAWTYELLGANTGAESRINELTPTLMASMKEWKAAAAKAHAAREEVPPKPTLRQLAQNALRKEVSKEEFDKRVAQANEKTEIPIQGMMAAEGTLGRDINKDLNKLLSGVNAYEGIRLLPLSLFSSLVDPAGIIVRGGTMKDAYDAFVRGIKEVGMGWMGKRTSDDDARLAEQIGMTDSGVFLDALGQTYSSVYMPKSINKAMNALFKWNGMEAWNRAMRIAAMRAGIGFIERHLSNPNEHSERYLKEELGLDPKGDWMKDGKLNTNIPLVQQALMRWVDGAILRPNAMQRPIVASDPHYKIFYYLKQFTYSFHKVIIERAMNELEHGNVAPLVTLFTVYVPMMIAADVAKELLVPGDEPAWMKAGLGAVVGHGIDRAGLGGIPGMYVDAMPFVGKGHTASLFGPAVDQLAGLSMVPFSDHHTAANELLSGLPAGNVMRRISPAPQDPSASGGGLGTTVGILDDMLPMAARLARKGA